MFFCQKIGELEAQTFFVVAVIEGLAFTQNYIRTSCECFICKGAIPQERSGPNVIKLCTAVIYECL